MSNASAQHTGLTRRKAWLCTIINLLAFPGLGTCMGGRIWSGVSQMVLVLLGMAFICAFFVTYLRDYVQTVVTADLNTMQAPDIQAYLWMLYFGLIPSAVSWLWSLLSSVQLLRESRPGATASTPPVPDAPLGPPDLP